MKLINKIVDVLFLKNLKEIILSFFAIFLSILIVFYGTEFRIYSIDANKFYQWLLIILICTIFLIYFYKKDKFSIIERLFIFYFILCGICSFYYTIGIEWFLLSLIVLFLNLNKLSKNKNYLISSIIFNNIFILSIVIYSFYLVREIFFLADGYYGIITFGKNEKGVNIPRSSGLSRSLCYVFITLLSVYLSIIISKKNKLRNSTYALLFLPIIILIYKLESRGSLLCLIFSIYSLGNTYLILKIKFIKIIFINLIILFALLVSLNYISYREFNGLEILYQSSGRFESWIKAFTELPFLIFGYGLQADRNILNLNISNLYIYAYLSSGIFGLFVLLSHIIALIKYLLDILKYFYKIKKNFISLFIFNYCILIFSYFAFRGLVENSFAIVSLDLIIWLTLINSVVYLKNLYAIKESSR